MNGYDFDNTIYDGESLLDFFFFCLSKDKRLLLCFPVVIKNLFLYAVQYIELEDVLKDADKYSYLYVDNKDFISYLVEEFWKKNKYKLKKKYLDKITNDDVIITACPNFLIDGIRDMLNTQNIISSVISENGKIDFLCFKENKYKKFIELYNKPLDCFYTDSYNDVSMLLHANNSYIVRGNTDILIDKKKIRKKYRVNKN